jgi:hypothetical protein
MLVGMRRASVLVVFGGLLAWAVVVTTLSVGVGDYLAYYDPQTDSERLEYHRDLAMHVYTAGYWLGQLIAAAAGARLVADAGGYSRTTVLRAAEAGGLLGLVVGAVAIVAGLFAMQTNGYPSVAPDPTMLSDPTVLRCLLAGLACFPLWAIIGAAIGGLVHSRQMLVIVLTMLCHPVTFLLWMGTVAPPSTHPLAVWAIGDADGAALRMPAILLVWATAATAAAAVAGRHMARFHP